MKRNRNQKPIPADLRYFRQYGSIFEPQNGTWSGRTACGRPHPAVTYRPAADHVCPSPTVRPSVLSVLRVRKIYIISLLFYRSAVPRRGSTRLFDRSVLQIEITFFRAALVVVELPPRGPRSSALRTERQCFVNRGRSNCWRWSTRAGNHQTGYILRQASIELAAISSERRGWPRPRCDRRLHCRHVKYA